MSRPIKDWRIYERFVARLMMLDLSTDLCVTPNARIRGKISRRSRQIDVLIDARHIHDSSRRIIVDAKRHRRKIDLTHVEAFLGLMQDVGATHGYLVCPAGHTDSALKRAQKAVSICLISLARLDGFDPSNWPRCQAENCHCGRVFWDGFPEVGLTVTAIEGSHGTRHIPYIHYVGKCDKCGKFHVKCLTCNETFALNDRDGEHQCGCRLPWFWLASIEGAEEDLSAELHLVTGAGRVSTVNRRPFTPDTVARRR
jgi:hypothetical protein